MLELIQLCCRSSTIFIFAKPFFLLFFPVKVRDFNHNGYLRSKRSLLPFEKVEGSLYQMIERESARKLASKGDWVLLRDGLTLHELKASEALSLAKK